MFTANSLSTWGESNRPRRKLSGDGWLATLKWAPDIGLGFFRLRAESIIVFFHPAEQDWPAPMAAWATFAPADSS